MLLARRGVIFNNCGGVCAVGGLQPPGDPDRLAARRGHRQFSGVVGAAAELWLALSALTVARRDHGIGWLGERRPGRCRAENTAQQAEPADLEASAAALSTIAR